MDAALQHARACESQVGGSAEAARRAEQRVADALAAASAAADKAAAAAAASERLEGTAHRAEQVAYIIFSLFLDILFAQE